MSKPIRVKSTETLEPQSPADVVRICRRETLLRLGAGFGGLALSGLLHETATAGSTYDLTPKRPHHPARAKAVIQLFMHGGPSHVDLLDPKPALKRHDGSPPPGSVVDDENRTKNLMGSPFKFRKCGQSGLEFSELMDKVSEHADDIAVVRSMFTEHRNHEQAIWMANTGLTVAGRPNIGSWVAYGLGAENQDLPAYVALPDPQGVPVDGVRNWSGGWLPPIYQGAAFRAEGDPVLHLRPKKKRAAAIEQARFRLLQTLNRQHRSRRPGQLELDARIASFELAGRMQLSATAALDLSRESKTTQQLYGLDNPVARHYGKRCLMARRLIERGVRYVQIFMRGQPWDTHTNNNAKTKECCQQTDLPIGGLLTDLKQRGLLDSTLVLWGGEFGRTPAAEQRDAKAAFGRDHHPYGYSIWMAGGGIRGGQAYGATDDFGYRSIVNRTKVSDLHATILHLLGLDHEQLTYAHHGRDEKLTDVYRARVLAPLVS